MRIDAFNKVSRLYQANSAANTVKSKNAGFSDKLEISKAGKDYQAAKQIVAHSPDVRESRVNEIKQRMESGTYHVSIQDLADKLVDEYFETI
ncbi:negative regulator of flagellin synthesis FlgM [Anaerotaenia torta]|uniref:flagellar biosynthesis anti-sigma factor FlgM n=1 Tax=Anaerotaenia torta TaxID=433293 RepID=UPI003D1D7B67